jgi:AIPR protein
MLRLGTSLADDGSQQMNTSVFFDNVRDFDPDSKINRSIISEVKTGDRKAFVFRNNGVTVIAKRLNRTGDRFTVEDYQIVNGCQTTNIMFHCREIIDELFVPFNLTARGRTFSPHPHQDFLKGFSRWQDLADA